ncbi:MAG: glutamine synthetase, partial [Rhodobacteraceae bacterium]|nr:glutamine synthetase [Paracoccaceae bacterium]
MPDTPSMIRAAVCDLNGIWRGKLMPATQLEKVMEGSLRMPHSVPAIDIFGEDVADSPLVFASGDADSLCLPTNRGPLPELWQSGAAQFVPVVMATEDGVPSAIDPRQILAGVAGKLKAQGFIPVMAVEMEFYLVKPGPTPPQSEAQMLAIDNVDEHSAFFEAVYAACAAYGIPADAAISEGGAGQFEINLLHGPDPL